MSTSSGHRVAGRVRRRHAAVRAGHRDPDAGGGTGRGVAEVPAGLGGGPGLPQVFEKINNDESRHIAVDFEVLDMIGHATARRLAIELVGRFASPGLVIGMVMYVPLLNRVRNEMAGMGMEPERLFNAVNRFKQLGERGERTRRVPTYKLLKRHASWWSTRGTPTSCWPTRWCGFRSTTPSRC